jgi:hypothetical protein
MADLTQFDFPSAVRIARVVRAVEQEPRRARPLTFDAIRSDSGGSRSMFLGTFTGNWPTGTLKTVTLHGSTQTASVYNWANPVAYSPTDATSHFVLFSPVRGTHSVVELEIPIPEIPTSLPDLCGKSQGPSLVSFAFESCFGDGAAGVATAPGETAGPINGVSLSSGGSGYARLGRVEPTLKVAGSGTGANFSVTLASSSDDCGLPYWKIDSVSVKDGVGYVDGEALTVSPQDGAIAEAAASLTLETARQPPTLSALVGGGAGAVLSVSVTSLGGSPETWGVSKIGVTSGGTGYLDKSPVQVKLGNGDRVQAVAVATARTGRSQPTITANVISITGAGSGGSIGVTISQTTDTEGRPVWRVGSLSILSAGSGYRPADTIQLVCTNGIQAAAATAFVASVNPVNGAITNVTLSAQGEFYVDTGAIALVNVSNGGAYYHEVPDSVTVNDGGRYFKEDATKSPYVSGVTVTINQTPPSAGSGAVVTPSIDSNTSSGTFGKITSLTIQNGGSGYLAWEHVYPLTWGNTDFSKLPGYVGGQTQVLGQDGGCLKWFSVTTCTTSTT